MAFPENKGVTILSPVGTVLRIVCSWGLFVASLIIHKEIWPVIFFGLCAAVSVWPLLQRGATILFKGTKKYKAYLKEEEEKMRIDAGIFEYTENGFKVLIDEATYSVPWSSITAILGYKVNDEVCLDVVTDAGDIFTFFEYTEGWYILMNKIAGQFPEISSTWSNSINGKDLATSITFLYKKKDDQLIDNYYNKGHKEQDIDPDAYPPYGNANHSMLFKV